MGIYMLLRSLLETPLSSQWEAWVVSHGCLTLQNGYCLQQEEQECGSIFLQGIKPKGLTKIDSLIFMIHASQAVLTSIIHPYLAGGETEAASQEIK